MLRDGGCTGPRFRDSGLGLCDVLNVQFLFLPDGGRRAVPVALDEPLLVVGPLGRRQRLAQIFDRVEPADPEQVLLERPDEPFGAAIALRGTDEVRGAPGSEEAYLALDGETPNAIRPSKRIERSCTDWRGHGGPLTSPRSGGPGWAAIRSMSAGAS
jgi:hypothetical protein